MITETREVSNFDSISLSGSGEVIVTQGGSESLAIETDDNVMEHVKAEVRCGTLNLSLEDVLTSISPLDSFLAWELTISRARVYRPQAILHKA